MYWHQDNFRGNSRKPLRLDSPSGIQEASSGFHRIRADSPRAASRQLAGSAKQSTVAVLPGKLPTSTKECSQCDVLAVFRSGWLAGEVCAFLCAGDTASPSSKEADLLE